MRMPRDFDFYLKEGTARRCSANKSRAQFLIEESINSMEGLKERIKAIKINKKNANSIVKDCYDILMELVRARMFNDGYSASGKGSHEAEVSYLAKMDFLPEEISFLNELRYFRNSATYYGKILDADYTEKVVKFTKSIHPKLLKLASSN